MEMILTRNAFKYLLNWIGFEIEKIESNQVEDLYQKYSEAEVDIMVEDLVEKLRGLDKEFLKLSDIERSSVSRFGDKIKSAEEIPTLNSIKEELTLKFRSQFNFATEYSGRITNAIYAIAGTAVNENLKNLSPIEYQRVIGQGYEKPSNLNSFDDWKSAA